jgi:orotate phosphoribosyltransferase
VVITEDAVTRGSSPMEAASVVRELGAEPVLIMPVVDRGGTCGELAEAEGIAFHPLVTAPDLGFPFERDA